MGTQYDQIDDNYRKFIEEQHMFFVATAAPDGKVNLSPKGQDALRVLGPNRIIWLNLTGSGNETAGHLMEHPRMTIMWCSYTLKPMIYRAYGTARTIHRDDPEWDELAAHFPDYMGARQIYDMTVEMTQKSCGYAVPRMSFEQDRDTLSKWADDKGPEGIRTYWTERNSKTLDGKPTRA
ncbi:MAG: pyridoxamine 5'-phosphate oxidase family protein [Paracoccaceae bacterium]